MFTIVIDHLIFSIVTELFILCEMLSVGHALRLMSAQQQAVKVTGIRPNNLINDGIPIPTITHKILSG